MDDVARLPARDRADLFRASAAKLQEKLDVSPLILEKDYWVCWTLEKVFSIPNSPGLIFKGGTSLSKAYSLIRRFSEDIDLVFDRKGFDVPDPRESGIAGKERERRREALIQACYDYISKKFLSKINSSFASILGIDGWSVAIDQGVLDCIVFTYPPSLDQADYGGGGYIKPAVRLEFGIRGEHTPAEKRFITPYVAGAGFDNLKIGSVSVTVLHPKRTFWEKVLIHHRSFFKPPNEDKHRHSRHSYDLATMADSWVRPEALADPGLFQEVVDHERVMFRRAPKKVYDDAVPGTIRVLPENKEQIDGLRKDYRSMQQMFFGQPPDFEVILTQLRHLEEEINSQ